MKSFIFKTLGLGLALLSLGSTALSAKPTAADLAQSGLYPMGPKGDKSLCATAHIGQMNLGFAGDELDLTPLTREELEAKGRKFDAKGNIIPEREGQQTTFWAINVATNALEQIPATLVRVTQNAYLYVENGKSLPEEVVNRIASQFDSKIYPISKAYFGDEVTPGIDFDTHITLLFMDIQDGWEPGKGYIGGYFYPLNCVSSRIFPQSNEREMFYLDINPSDPTREDYLGVLGHEFHHLIHFSHDPREEVWLNEGCAQLNFYVTGYGHPSQIFSFLPRPDKQLNNYEKSVVDYGVSYLWFYYLYTKYAGATEANRKEFFRALVDSKERGFAGIQALLTQNGVQKSVEDIFADWSVAGVTNPFSGGNELGYDKTLNFRVYDTAIHAQLPVEKKDETVTPWGNDYIRFTPELLWEPQNPIFFGKVRVYGASEGNVHWTVNGSTVADPALWPEGSSLLAGEQGVSTPLQKDEATSKWYADFGPFTKGTPIRTFNFKTVHGDSQSAAREVRIINKDFSNALRNFAPNAAGDLVIEFQGSKGGMMDKEAGFVVQAVSFKADGSFERHRLELDKEMKGSLRVAGYGASVKEVVLIPSARSKKPLKYSYKAAVESKPSVPALENLLASTRYVQNTRLALQKEVNADPSLASIGQQMVDLEDGLVTTLVASAKELSTADKTGVKAWAQKNLGTAGPLTETLKKQLTVALGDLEIPANGKREEGDSAHSNWDYLLFKLGENFHALTHLKIDPVMLEGQILQMYQLLKILYGLPDIHFPDGLALVDYQCESIASLMAEWKAANNEADKPACQRLRIATFWVENVYNNSLVLVDDTMKTFVDAGEMVWQSNKVIKMIADGFQNVPIVGTIAQKVRYLIISKTLRVVDDIIWVAAPYIPQKYQKYLPFASLIVLNVLPHILGVKVEQEQQLPYKEMITFVAKTVGKYAVTSLPKIGYVAKTQPSVDLAAKMAKDKDMDGTLDEAAHKSELALFNLVGTTQDKIAVAERDRKIADITNKIFQIAKLGMVIDPTNISKVVSIVAALATGGLIAHAAGTTALFYVKHPKMANEGVLSAFHPNLNPSTEAGENRAKISSDYLARGSGLLEGAFRSYDKALNELEKAVQTKDVALVSDLMDSFKSSDEEVAGTLQTLQSFALSAAIGNTDKREVAEGYESTIKAATSLEFAQADLYGGILAFAVNPDNGAELQQKIVTLRNEQSYLRSVVKNLTQWSTKSALPCATLGGIHWPKFIKEGEKGTVTAYVANYGQSTLKNVEVELIGNGFTKVEGTSTVKFESLEPYSERMIEFTIVGENIDQTKDGAMMLGVEGEGTAFTHRSLFIEAIKGPAPIAPLPMPNGK